MTKHHTPMLPYGPKPKFPNVQETRKILAEEVVPPVDPNVREQDVEHLSRQNRLVLSLLREGPLTQIDADKWNVRRLAARVLDLRSAKYRISEERVGRISKYTLEKA